MSKNIKKSAAEEPATDVDWSQFTESDRQVMRAMLARLRAGKDLREEKIHRIKKAIAANEYENTLKLEVAVDRMTETLDVVSRANVP
jgi:hypothetical protein